MIKFMNWRFRPTDPIWILANTIHGIFYSRIRRSIGFQWRGGFVGVILVERGAVIPAARGESGTLPVETVESGDT